MYDWSRCNLAEFPWHEVSEQDYNDEVDRCTVFVTIATRRQHGLLAAALFFDTRESNNYVGKAVHRYLVVNRIQLYLGDQLETSDDLLNVHA